MESLEKCKDLLHEVIVVDDASPDNAAEVLKGSFATVIQNEKNEGFAKTCNRGYEESTGDAILFLNSDTIVPRAGLIRLIEGLMESGTVGAAGPVSNNVSAYQKIDPTYTDIKNLDLFANDLALSDRENKDVELLIGFALAVRRSVLEEVGLFDERFGRGMYEDNDLCYRILRAGYRLKMVSNAYIHHWGSRTLRRVIPDPIDLLNKNGAAYKEKWRADLESGYASHLPGLGKGLVVFDPAKHPEKISAHIARLAKQADISLCMIVKNEARMVGQEGTGTTATFAYDQIGNTLLKWHQGGLMMTMSYDAASRLTTMVQGQAITAYTFDANGNQVLENQAGIQTGYVYDKENRLTKVTHSDGSLSTYAYSGDGLRRLRQEPTDPAPHTIVWDGSDYLGEY